MFDLGQTDRGLQRAGDLLGDAILQVEALVDRAVVTRAPDMRAALGFDELSGDAEPIADLLHAAFEQIGDTELLADGARIGGAALVGKGRAAAITKGLMQDSAAVMASTMPSARKS